MTHDSDGMEEETAPDTPQDEAADDTSQDSSDLICPDTGGNRLPPVEAELIPLRFRGIAKVCVDFFTRRGLRFDDIQNLYQSLFIAFADATDGNPGITDYELAQIGRRIVARQHAQDSREYSKIATLRSDPIEELSGTGTTFGSRLKTMRLLNGFPQQTDLAQRIGVSPGALSFWESGTQLPDPPNMKLIAETLRTTVAYLLAGVEEDEVIGRDIGAKESTFGRKLLGLKIRILRYKCGFFAQDMVEGTGISFTTLSDIESGKKVAYGQSLRKIAGFLGVSLGVLVAGIERDRWIAVRADDERDPGSAKALGLKLKLLRYENGLSLAALAQQSGISMASLMRYENGERLPQASQLKALAPILNTTVCELLSGVKREELLARRIDKHDCSTFGLKLKVLRYEQGLLIKQVAIPLGLSPMTLSEIEHGGRKPQDGTVDSLCSFFGVNVEDILNGSPVSSRAQEPPTPNP